MSRQSRGGRPTGGAATMPVAHSAAATPVELDSHAIDIAAEDDQRKRRRSKGEKATKQQQQQKSKAPTRDSDDDGSDEDPFTDPPGAGFSSTTAGDQFYDSFAALELKIATGSMRLSEVIKILKQIRLHPDFADRLADELDEKLSETGALLTEVELIQKKFNGLNTTSNARGKFSAEEKTKRGSLRERVSQDIGQLTNSFRQVRQASMPHINSGRTGSYDPYSEEDPSHHSLLSDADGSAAASPLVSGGQYQSEYIGELDGHLAMLAEQAAERSRFMRTIERDVIQVQSLFKDVHDLVHAQQPMIDENEYRITDTQENARLGMEQLLQAQQYQASKRKRMCCLVLLMIVAVFLFFLFLWVLIGGK